jgi:putative ABC transport system substrate-binding protein
MAVLSWHPVQSLLSDASLSLHWLASSICQLEQARGGASYIDRVLRGANPGELPVQLPTRYELAINLKTAKTLGLKIPESFLLRADEVIE